jgi:phenylacetic acid degradation operon negative regulatory protein
VVPRGGEVWIGNIIETCAAVGISETLVRTAVSRLVAAGQLVGRRSGRRGYYRLAPAAEAEFAAADRAIYGPPDACGWRFTVLPEAGAEAQMATLERAGHARLRPQLAFGPDRDPPPPGALVFRSVPEGATDLLPAFAAAAFDLGAHARAYDASPTRLESLDAASLDGSAALTARLLLVHAWRAVVLRDPRLPAEALPSDWPGHGARALFARLYRALSPAADSHVARVYAATAGRLAAATPATEARLARLADGPPPLESETAQDLAGEPLHE